MGPEETRYIIEYAGAGWFGIFAGAIGVLVVGGLAVVAVQLRSLHVRVEKARQSIWELQVKLAKREGNTH